MKIEDYPIFLSSTDTLKETSKDSSKKPAQYMTELTMNVVNFDKARRKYVREWIPNQDAVSSADALVFLPDCPVFIEFKNGKVEKDDVKRDIVKKIRDSLLIYGGITGQTITETRKKMEFILVYNPQKNIDKSHSPSREEILKSVAKKAETEIVRFDLERYRTLYFFDVHTYTPTELENYLTSRGVAEMPQP